MAAPEKISVEDTQRYYDSTDRIRLKPGWMQGEGQPLPEMEPYLWRWSEVEPLVLRSGDLVTPDRDVERRTLRLATPAWTEAPPIQSPRPCSSCCPANAPRPTVTLPRPSGGC